MKLGPLEIRWHRFDIFEDMRIMKVLNENASWLECFLVCLYVRTPLCREKGKIQEYPSSR